MSATIRSFVLLLVLSAAACTQLQPREQQWQSGPYSAALNEDGLRLYQGNAVFAHIKSFSFNFVPATITDIKSATDDGFVLTLELAGGDGFSDSFPATLHLTVSYSDNTLHFQASHETFNHIGIQLADRNEHYFGLLEKLYPDNRKSPDLRGETVDVEVYHQGEKDYAENYASAFSAFYMSSAGYGSFFDTFAKGQYRFAKEGTTHIYHQTDSLDWYLFYGPEGTSIHRAYYDVIGEPKSVPIWALGPVVWRDYNTGKDEILNDMRRFAELEIPLTATFVDRPYSDGGHEWSKMNFAEPFANPEQWIATINNDYGMEVMSWVGPMTFGDQDFPGLLPNHRTYIDLTHPDALAEFERRMETQQYAVGIKGHKMDRADENFPFTAAWHEPVSESVARNKYVHLYAQTIDRFLQNAHGQDQFNFARAAFHRTQPHLSAVWGGDVRPNWLGMAGNQANAMRTGFMGFPVWGSDTGGYLGDGYIDEKLYARWLQWGAWNGMFEVKLDGIGGQGEDRAPWRYPESLQRVFRQAAEQRMALIPYSYSLANTSADNGVLMKPMAYIYPEDENTYSIWDQYQFGEAFLVAPLFGPEDHRDIYLPEGRWYDFHNLSRAYTGGETIERSYGDSQIPVFIKANSLYLTGDIYRGSSQRWQGALQGDESLAIHLFPGRPGEQTRFTYVDYLDHNRHKDMLLERNAGKVRFTSPALTIPASLATRLDSEPETVRLNGASVEFQFDEVQRVLTLAVPAGVPVELVVE